jgi:hypothetical protein
MPGLTQSEQFSSRLDAVRAGWRPAYDGFLGGDRQAEVPTPRLPQPQEKAPSPSPPGRAHLEDLIKRRFLPEGKAERVARALKALHEAPSIELSHEDWAWVAENADIEDQYD